MLITSISPSSSPSKSSEAPKSPPLEVNSCYLSITLNPSDGFVLADSSSANLLPAQFVRLALHLCSIWSEGTDVSTAGWWETSFRLLVCKLGGARIWIVLVRFYIWCKSYRHVLNLPLICFVFCLFVFLSSLHCQLLDIHFNLPEKIVWTNSELVELFVFSGNFSSGGKTQINISMLVSSV